jgi:hypothetical protein
LLGQPLPSVYPYMPDDGHSKHPDLFVARTYPTARCTWANACKVPAKDTRQLQPTFRNLRDLYGNAAFSRVAHSVQCRALAKEYT